MPRVLMIAYHFPPLAGSSGIQRTLRFVQHLPEFGWTPMVLTTQVLAYERVSPDLDADVPRGTVVRRAFALDTARHLSLGGRYPSVLARPDRWASWRFDGIRKGMALVAEQAPGVIWSTFPIATAHVIGAALQRRTGLPWIADFRDPMVQPDYPPDPRLREHLAQIEAEVARRAAYVVVTTPSAKREFEGRYPEAGARVRLIENGYDEESFAAASGRAMTPLNPGTLTLLHSGIVYESERDPTQLMVALRRLHLTGRIRPGMLKVRFRAAQADSLLTGLASSHGVLDYVELSPPIPYREALAEMLNADALLLLQAANCNAQVPAKLYEYVRAGRPVLALVDPRGDTALTLRAAGIHSLADPTSAEQIEQLLSTFLDPDASHEGMVSNPALRERASRRGRARELLDLLQTAAPKVRMRAA